jgi:hypothetical protein
MTMGDQPLPSESEPTVLDWVKSILRLKPIPIPEHVDVEETVEEISPPSVPQPIFTKPESAVESAIQQDAIRISAKHVRLPIALLLGFFAQFSLESRVENIAFAIGMYLIAAVLVGWAVWERDFSLIYPLSIEWEALPGDVKWQYLGAGVVLTLLTFFTSRENRFNLLNLVLWIGSLICMMIAFWEGESPFRGLWNWIKVIGHEKRLDIQIRPWYILVIATILIVVFFRTTQIEQVPYEMWSDQAEKLWDVMDVLNGQTSIFFPRNTGREAMQFYMAAAVIKLFDTGISFTTLKITTILAGLIMLPYLYLFAKEYGGRYVGLAAVLLAGVGYWPNVISRLGLRFPLFPLFVAPAMYYLLRGFRLKRRNDFILCGLATGLGLHGYSPARVIPLAVLVGFVLFFINRVSKERRREVFTWFIITAVIALVVFAPLLGAISDTQMMTLYLNRMVSRFSSIEQSLPDTPLKLLIGNLWRGLRMFGWDDGEIWVVSIPYRPILDWVTGALFHLGVVIVFVRFLKRRRWEDLFLLLLILVLILPSILSLSFPDENPAPNRASGAIIPVFTIAAIPLVLLPNWAKEVFKRKASYWMAIVMSIQLFVIAAVLNYGLVFDEFVEQHRKSTWNTSEIGKVIKGFAETIGSYQTAHVIPYPHWVDTRLVGINAGDPYKDYGVWPQDLENIPPEDDRPQLFIFKPEDSDGLERLRQLYPNGILRHGESAVEGRDFMLYYVFPEGSIELENELPEQ